jgi:hypothetical protein
LFGGRLFSVPSVGGWWGYAGELLPQLFEIGAALARELSGQNSLEPSDTPRVLPLDYNDRESPPSEICASVEAGFA